MMMKRFLLRTIFAVSTTLFLAASIFWARGSDWMGHRGSFSRPAGSDAGAPVVDVGETWRGLYSNNGQIGFVRIDEGLAGMELDEIASVGPAVPQSSWFWRRDGDTESYLGTLPDELSNADSTWRIRGFLCIYQGDDAAMRHFEQIHAIMVNDCSLITTTAVPIVIYSGFALISVFRRFDDQLAVGYPHRFSNGKRM